MRSVLVVGVLLAAACEGGRGPRRPDAGAARNTAPKTTKGPDAGLDAAPPEDLWGVAAFFMTNVYQAPDFDSPRLGWIRVGARMDLMKRVREGSRFCSDGWYSLRDQPGYVCAGKGIVVGRMPRSVRYGSAPAALDQLNPYDYGFITRDGTPLYRRRPTREEQREIDARWIAALAADAGAGGGGASTDGGAAPATADGGPGTPEVFDPSPRVGSSHRGDDEDEDGDEDEDEDRDRDRDRDEDGDEGDAGDEEDGMEGLLVRRMDKGNYVAVDRRMGRGGRLFYRTIRGRYVQVNRLFMVGPPTFQGFDLAPGTSSVPPLAPPDGGPPPGDEADAGTAEPVTLPAGIVYYWRARKFHESKDGRRVFPRRRLERLTKFRIVGEREIDGATYYDTGEGFFVKADQARKLAARRPPRFVEEGQKWIDVDISEQTLIAYEWDRPVYATVVSTGLEDEEHMTPRGRFRIQSKHFSFTMADDRASDGPYSVEDVPYVMYFQLSYALHSAFWHGWYGRNRSHGCVNLAPADARWLFYWVDPQIPDGWYGVWAQREDEGTLVVIRN